MIPISHPADTCLDDLLGGCCAGRPTGRPRRGLQWQDKGTGCAHRRGDTPSAPPAPLRISPYMLERMRAVCSAEGPSCYAYRVGAIPIIASPKIRMRQSDRPFTAPGFYNELLAVVIGSGWPCRKAEMRPRQEGTRSKRRCAGPGCSGGPLPRLLRRRTKTSFPRRPPEGSTAWNRVEVLARVLQEPPAGHAGRPREPPQHGRPTSSRIA